MRSKKKCLLTGEDHLEGIGRRNCSGCKSVWSAVWRKTKTGERYVGRRHKARKRTARLWAQRKVQGAIQRGKLRPAKEFKCVDCGEPACAYDHRDYLKPLDVDPVCSRCNHSRGPGKNNHLKIFRGRILL